MTQGPPNQDNPFSGWPPPQSPQEAQQRAQLMQDWLREQWTREREQEKDGGDWSRKLFEVSIGTGQNALKALGTINGAGAAALLAFIGHLWTDGHGSQHDAIVRLSYSLLAFLVGMVFAVGSLAAAYYAQLFIAERHNALRLKNKDKQAVDEKKALVWARTCEGIACFSALAFVVGACIALWVFVRSTPS